MSSDFVKAIRDKQVISQARGLRDVYLKAREVAHERLRGDTLYQTMEEAMEIFVKGLAELGFASLDDFDIADRTLTEVENAESLNSVAFENRGKVLNFVDLTGLPYEFSGAATETLTHYSETGVLPNSFLFNWIKLDQPWGLMRYEDTPESLAHKARLEAEGIKPYRSVLTKRNAPPYAKDEVYLRLYTSELAGSPEDAFLAIKAIATRMFGALGIEVLPRHRSNDLVEFSTARKIAGGTCYRYRNVNIAMMLCYRDFDYEVGARVFQDPNISKRVITVKDVLGYEPDAEAYRAAVLKALPAVFGCSVTKRKLPKAVNDQLTNLAEKYAGDWITPSLINPDEVEPGEHRR